MTHCNPLEVVRADDCLLSNVALALSSAGDLNCSSRVPVTRPHHAAPPLRSDQSTIYSDTKYKGWTLKKVPTQNDPLVPINFILGAHEPITLNSQILGCLD